MCRALERLLHMIKSDKEIDLAKTNANAELQCLYDSIIALAEAAVPFYDKIEGYFFQDIDYRLFQGATPIWMSDAGRSVECSWNRVFYDKVRQIYNDPISNRVLHLYDVRSIVSAFQDRATAVNKYLREIFAVIPAYCLYSDDDYSNAMRDMSDRSDQVHASINNVFVSLSSAFDLFTKIVYECSRYDPKNFTNYKKLKSRADSVLYAKKNFGFDELKEPGLLYDEPKCIRTICSFRDEFIHSGSWDYRCAVYYPNINGELVEPFIPMPDIEPSGVLVSSGSRNKFYASGAKINIEMPVLVGEVIEVLSKTLERLKEVLDSKTIPLPQEEREKNAMAYMKVLTENAKKLPGVFVKKESNLELST